MKNQMKVLVGALGATALAAAVWMAQPIATVLAAPESSTNYTACLKNGALDHVAVGDEPASPCKSGETQVRWNAAGVAGSDGATWYSGATLPEATLGTDGDLYLLLGDDGGAGAGDVFVKQDGTWISRANLAGPRGPQGAPGPRGPHGEPGPAGGPYVVTLAVPDGDSIVLPESGEAVPVLHADLPAGLYTDLKFEVTWRSNAGDYSDATKPAAFTGLVCETDPGRRRAAENGMTDFADHPLAAAGELAATPLEPVTGLVAFSHVDIVFDAYDVFEVGDDGLTLACESDMAVVLEDGSHQQLTVEIVERSFEGSDPLHWQKSDFRGAIATWMEVTPVGEHQVFSGQN